MKTSTLITDSSSPFACALAAEYAARGQPVCLAAETLTAKPDKNGLVGPESGPLLRHWLKTSALSARSLVLACETVLGAPVVAVLCLDAFALAESFVERTEQAGGAGMADLLGRCLDTAVKPVAHLAQDLLSRFNRTEGGTLCFVIREADMPGANSTTGSGVSPSADMLLAAGVTSAAFSSFAESCARKAAARTGLRVLLIKLEDADENANALWVAERLAEPAARTQSVRWLKAGSRGLFSR